jgi:hypothetical protein
MTTSGRDRQHLLPSPPPISGSPLDRPLDRAVQGSNPNQSPTMMATTLSTAFTDDNNTLVAGGLSYDKLLQAVAQLPLLSKQVLYVLLKRWLESRLSQHTLEKMDADNLLQLWVPQLTHMGMQTLQQLGAGNESSMSTHPMFRLLRCVHAKCTVSQICVVNHWTLAEGCMLLNQAIQKEWLIPSPSGLVVGAVMFITDQIRLGEFLLRLGKVTSEQLDQGLKTQQYAWEVMGQRSAIGNILMNLGYVSKEDIEGILLMKQESKKPLY